jgi:hypothetical protein
LPAEPELQRLVNAAPNGYFHDLYECVTSQMTAPVRARMDELLVVPKEGALNVRVTEGRCRECRRLKYGKRDRETAVLLRSVGLPAAPFAKTPMKVLHLLKRRAWTEQASEMREHPEAISVILFV